MPTYRYAGFDIQHCVRYDAIPWRFTTEISMKTTSGYFLWEHVAIVDDRLHIAIDWW